MPRKSVQPERVGYGATWRRTQRGDDRPHQREPRQQSRHRLLTSVASRPRKRSEKPQSGGVGCIHAPYPYSGGGRAAMGDVLALPPRASPRLKPEWGETACWLDAQHDGGIGCSAAVASIKISLSLEETPVKPKLYPAEKVADIAKTLADVPALPPKFIPHSDTLAELSRHIKDMHFRKNYDARQIAQILKEHGIRTTIKEVRSILQNSGKKTSKSGDKIAS